MRKRRDEEKADERTAVVPVDPFNETVILAAVMVSRPAADSLLPGYPPEFFYARGHARAWEVLREMHRRGLYYDPQTVAQMSGGEVDVAYLDGLVRDRPESPPNLRHHVDALRWDHARVEGARGPLAALLTALGNVTSAPDRVRSLAVQVADAFQGHGSDVYLRSARDVTLQHAKVLRDRRTGRACYSFGFPGLDVYQDGPFCGQPRMIPGTAPGMVSLVTGVSGAAKTSFTCAMIAEMARQGRRCLVGAWEPGAGMSLELIAACSLGMSRNDVSTGRFTEQDENDLRAEMERLGEWISFFELPFGSARSRERNANDRQLDLVRQVLADSRCELFFADLMRRALKETDPDDEEQALYRLQSDGQKLHVHQVWLHQIRLKDVEQRGDKRPTREGMKGSSAWVEVPDTILGLHRPALWKNVPDDKLEIIVLKQRYGRWPLAVEFDWDAEFVSIEGGRSIDYQRPGEEDDMDAFLKAGSRRRR